MYKLPGTGVWIKNDKIGITKVDINLEYRFYDHPHSLDQKIGDRLKGCNGITSTAIRCSCLEALRPSGKLYVLPASHG